MTCREKDSLTEYVRWKCPEGIYLFRILTFLSYEVTLRWEKQKPSILPRQLLLI